MVAVQFGIGFDLKLSLDGHRFSNLLLFQDVVDLLDYRVMPARQLVVDDDVISRFPPDGQHGLCDRHFLDDGVFEFDLNLCHTSPPKALL